MAFPEAPAARLQRWLVRILGAPQVARVTLALLVVVAKVLHCHLAELVARVSLAPHLVSQSVVVEHAAELVSQQLPRTHLHPALENRIALGLPLMSPR